LPAFYNSPACQKATPAVCLSGRYFSEKKQKIAGNLPTLRIFINEKPAKVNGYLKSE